MKTAMVWGGAGGIGRAVVEKLMASGWTVVALSRDEETVRELASHSLSVDINDPFSVQRAAQGAAFEVSSVDLWVYAAGDIISSPLEQMTPSIWNRILSANLTGAYLAAHYSLPLLSPGAHMIFVGAVSERLRLPGLSAYAAAKAGLEAMVETLRKEQRQHRVSIIRPSAVDTPLWDKVPLKLPRTAIAPAVVAEKILEAYESGHTGTLELD